MGKSQSKPTANAQKKKRKGRKGDGSNEPYVNPNEETATPTFDEPARVRILSSPTKDRPKAAASRRPPSRQGRISTVTRDSYGAQLDPGSSVGGDERIVNGATSLQVSDTLDKTNKQDGVVGSDKKVPKVALKPNRTSGNKKEKETSPTNGVPAGTVNKSPQIKIRSPSENMAPGLQESVQEEATTSTGRKSLVFVPDTSDSPRTPRLPRVSLKRSMSPSPNPDHQQYHRCESEPAESITGLSASKPALVKSLSSEPLLESIRSTKTPPRSRSQPPSRSPSPKTSLARQIPADGETPEKTQDVAGSSCSSSKTTPVLPRLPFDKVTVAKMLDNTKKHRRAASERRSLDFEPLTREERKRRRSSCDNFFRDKLNALLDPSAGSSKNPHDQLAVDDFPTPSPEPFRTPQPKRREMSSENNTPKLKRPLLKATT